MRQRGRTDAATEDAAVVLIAIDPGPVKSAMVALDEDGAPVHALYADNGEILNLLVHQWCDLPLYIEMIACYGMAVGAEVFETCVWIGRFMQAYGPGLCDRVLRREVKLHICHNSGAKDANIRQAIIDRFGGKDRAIGKKATPGPLYDIAGDLWAALAVGLYAFDRRAYNKAVSR